MKPRGVKNSMKLHTSGEDYLEAILIQQNRNGCARSVDVAEFLGVSKASVCRAIRLLREGGFVDMDREKLLRLTKVGLEAARQIYERHCLLTEILIALGVNAETAEEDACRIEHDLSADSFGKIREFWQKRTGETESRSAFGQEKQKSSENRPARPHDGNHPPERP